MGQKIEHQKRGDQQQKMELLTNISLGKALRDYRKRNKLTQGDLAFLLGIDQKSISNYEMDARYPEEEVLERIYGYMPWLVNNGNPLESIFDYVRVRFNNLDPKFVVTNILNLKLDFFQEDERYMLHYSSALTYGNIRVLYSPDKKSQGVLVEMTGSGCRQYEYLFATDGFTWTNFFAICLHFQGVFKRIDIAVNDYLPMLKIPDLIERLNRFYYTSKFRTINWHGGVHTPVTMERLGESSGSTIYFGAAKSNVRIVFYQKNFEQAEKYDVLPEDYPIKNRYEVRFSDDYAEDVAYQYLSEADTTNLVLGVISNYIMFREKPQDESLLRKDWEVSQDWLIFLNDVPDVHLTMKPKQFSVERTINALSHQYGSAIAMVKRLDRATGSNYIDNIVDKSEMSKRHEKMLKGYLAEHSELIEDPNWNMASD